MGALSDETKPVPSTGTGFVVNNPRHLGTPPRAPSLNPEAIRDSGRGSSPGSRAHNR